MNVVENFFSVADWIFSTMLSYDLIMIVRNPFVNNNKYRVKQGWILLSIYIVFFITFFLIHSHSMDMDKMKIKHYTFGGVEYWQGFLMLDVLYQETFNVHIISLIFIVIELIVSLRCVYVAYYGIKKRQGLDNKIQM